MRFRLILPMLLAAAAITAWQAETRAALEQRLLLRSLTAQLTPLGSLSYGATSAHFWGSGRVENLRFAPDADWIARHALPADFALHIPQLHYSDWQADEGWPAAVRLQFDTATLPLPAPWPRTASGTLDWQYRRVEGTLRVALTLDAPRAAAADATLSLQLAAPQRLTGATLLGGTLQYRDQGLAQGARAALALQLGADPQNADSALAEMLAQWLTEQGLPPTAELRESLTAFAREPLALTLHLDPPGALRPDTLLLFAPADRIAALGLSVQAQ
ncbi:MAG: hypothetical protein Q7J29_05450 [Stagnimonas sp.]|nr:hypothetical protein [Stagnimonas sp.]